MREGTDRYRLTPMAFIDRALNRSGKSELIKIRTHRLKKLQEKIAKFKQRYEILVVIAWA